jgi:acyl carrier protein
VLPRDLEERFFALSGAELHNLYGPTEAAIDVAFWDCERGSRRSTVPIGRPIARTQVYILDRQHEPVPIGVAGELFIGGEGLARGYWKRPELTAASFIPNPFGPPGTRLYATGDRARILGDGTIEYLGRLDYQVKIRGFRVELGEIEAVLARHPAIREAVVVARMKLKEQQLVAYLALRGSEVPSSGQLRRFVAGNLPDYMIPSVFVFLEAMPLSANGKIDRRALPAPAEGERPRLNGAVVLPSSEIEQTIAAIWRQVLRIETIGIHDNFFELGGHSLLLAQVHAQLTQTFGNGMSLAEMLEFPTVDALAQRVHGQRTPATPRASAPSGARSSLIEQRLLRIKARQAT